MSAGFRGASRGAFYKAKYGSVASTGRLSPLGARGISSTVPQEHNSGRGRGGGGWGGYGGSQTANSSPQSSEELVKILQAINGQPYNNYRKLYGNYKFAKSETKNSPEFTLWVDHIQADSYAPPSRFRAIVPMSLAQFPEDTFNPGIRKIALCDQISRRIASLLGHNPSSGPPHGGITQRMSPTGAITINAPVQQVLQRSSVLISDSPSGKNVELRFTVGLPANGRSILGDRASEILTRQLPKAIAGSLYYSSYQAEQLKENIESVEDQEYLRNSLKERDLVAFVGNGSILPRTSGISPLPMTGEAVVPFQSPPSLEVTIDTPNQGPITGMGIKRGITLLTGGGFHGKSTLLEALENGVYNHVRGDGRETVVTGDAFKIRAEDGRSVESCDLTPYVGKLPGGKTTEGFTSPDASGSTSMAANIQEALELGATTLLLDEDSCATNLLVKDARMSALIEAEPLTPLVAKVKSLFTEHGVSTILVIGGCGDYLSVADTTICLESYNPHDYTPKAQKIVAQFPVTINSTPTYGTIPTRIGALPPFHQNRSPGTRDIKVIYSQHCPDIDLSTLNQLVEPGQAKTCAEILRFISRKSAALRESGKEGLTMREWREVIERTMANPQGGLDAFHIDGFLLPDLVAVRGYEALAVVNRVRGLRVENVPAEAEEKRQESAEERINMVLAEVLINMERSSMKTE